MTLRNSQAVQEEVPSGAPRPESQAQADALRAKSLSPALVTALEEKPDAVTLSYRDRAQARADALGTKVRGALSGPSLWHSAPSSLEEARAGHHAAVAHWEAALMRGPRLAWGYGIHLPAKGAGHLVDWLFSSPVITVSAFLIYMACHYWLLHWLPWF
jgi:hypothetical protein